MPNKITDDLKEPQKLSGFDQELEVQILETKSQLRELFGNFAPPLRSRRKGLQHLADIKLVSELRRGLGRLASLGGLRDE